MNLIAQRNPTAYRHRFMAEDSRATQPMLDWCEVSTRLSQCQSYFLMCTNPEGVNVSCPIKGLWIDNVLYFNGDPGSELQAYRRPSFRSRLMFRVKHFMYQLNMKIRYALVLNNRSHVTSFVSASVSYTGGNPFTLWQEEFVHVESAYLGIADSENPITLNGAPGLFELDADDREFLSEAYMTKYSTTKNRAAFDDTAFVFRPKRADAWLGDFNRRTLFYFS